MPMPDDPDKKMDDLLKAYARERRKAPEVQLHPATRRALQSEVSRVFGRENSGTSWLHRLRAFWPQLAFGGSLCLILGIAVLSLRQPPGSPEKSIQENAAKEAKKSVPSPASDAVVTFNSEAEGIAPVQKSPEPSLRKAEQLLESPEARSDAPARGYSKDQLAVEESLKPAPVTLEQDSRRLSAQMPRPPQVSAPNESGVALQDREVLKQKADQQIATRAPAIAPRLESGKSSAKTTMPAQQSDVDVLSSSPVSGASSATLQFSSAEKLARANELTNLGAARRLQFVQTGGTVQQTPTAMFSSFQMEQFGTNVRFFDQDGSIYLGGIEQPTNAVEGAVLSVPVTATSAARRTRGAQERSQDEAAAAQNQAAFSFRASGTNRTLGRPVILTGQYFEGANAPIPADAYGGAAKAQTGARLEQRLEQRQQQQQAQRMIIGTAVVSETNQIQLRAVSRE